MLILQIIDSSIDSTAVVETGNSVSVMDLILQGGFMMVPIGLLSIAAIYIFVERVLTIRKSVGTPDGATCRGAARSGLEFRFFVMELSIPLCSEPQSHILRVPGG